MFRFRKSMTLMAILAGLAMAGLASPAQAAFEISVYVNGVNQGVSASGSNTAFFAIGSVTGFNYNISSFTNWSGTPASGVESNTANNQITVTAPITTPETVTIVISESGWVAPTGPLALSSSAGGSIASAAGSLTMSATNQGFVDSSFGNGVAGLNPAGTSTTLANASATSTPGNTGTLNYNPSPSTVLAAGGTPFTLTQVFTFSAGTGQTVATGSTFDVSGSVSVAPVPVPAGLVLALTGLPCLGAGTWLRRRLGKSV